MAADLPPAGRAAAGHRAGRRARSRVLPPPALLARLERRLAAADRRAARRRRPGSGRCATPSPGATTCSTPEEQALFRRLAVFAGGFTLEAAEASAVAAADGRRDDPDDPAARVPSPRRPRRVASLVANSLLRPEAGPDGEPRYGMLETVREYGLERLAESGEEAVVRDRHAAWCLGLAERYWVEEASWVERPGLAGARRGRSTTTCGRPWPGWSGPATGRGCCGWRGRPSPSGTCAATGPRRSPGWSAGWTAARAHRPRRASAPWPRSGATSKRQGYYARATGVHEALLALAREHGDALWEAGALYLLGLGALNQERYDEATPLIEGAMAAFRRLGDEGGVCRCHYCSGIIAYGRGDLAAAAAHLEAALAWRRDRGSVANLTVPLNALGLVACDRGDHRAAAALLAEGLTRWEQDGGGSREVLAEWLAAVARLAACRGRAGDRRPPVRRGGGAVRRDRRTPGRAPPLRLPPARRRPPGHPGRRGVRRNLGRRPGAAPGAGHRGSAGGDGRSRRRRSQRANSMKGCGAVSPRFSRTRSDCVRCCQGQLGTWPGE